MQYDDIIFNVNVTSTAKKLAEKYGYLPYMVQRYYEILHDWEEVKLLLEGNEKGIRQSIRCNDLKIKCKELEKILRSKHVILEKIPWTLHGYWVLHSNISIGALHEYLRGYYYIQGPASMIPPYVLAPRPKEIVADLAAAPGGKTTQMAQLMKNTGTIIAIEKDNRRIKALVSNIRRLGVKNTIVLNMDARKIKEFNDYFDKVLLDAPCTGEGLIPLKPERKTSRTISDLRKMHMFQVELLNLAIKITRPGGTIVYSTCSIAPEENEYVLFKALEKNENIKILKIQLPIGVSGLEEYKNIEFGKEFKYTRRFYPYLTGTEGFFIALLKKIF